jgi:hypothetical protein
MATHEIARENWAEFLEDFSKRHEGAEVEADAVSPQSGVRPETQWLPFVGIEFEEKGSEAGTIRLLTGTVIGDNSIEITSPKQVYHKPGAGVMSDEVTENEILEITSADEPPITYLRFRKA